jgi:signal transduction histidine kinase
MSIGMTLLSGFEPSPRAARVHAMKNCVSVIVALCRLAERETWVASRERWKHLQAAAHRLRDLLAEDLAMPGDEDQVEQQRVDGGLCSVEALVNAVTERLQPRAEEAGVDLTVDCGGGAIRGDQADLGEALFNLATNAIEATPRGGAVKLETRELRGGDQQWTLRDAGPGIADDQLARLGQACPSRKQGGSGLGVALACAAIARHGGLLGIESRNSSGTSVTILLERGADRCGA